MISQQQQYGIPLCGVIIVIDLHRDVRIGTVLKYLSLLLDPSSECA